MAEIARMTDHQLLNVYFRPRDRDGRLVREPAAGEGGEPLTFEALFWSVWKERGLTGGEIRQKWEEFQRRGY